MINLQDVKPILLTIGLMRAELPSPVERNQAVERRELRVAVKRAMLTPHASLAVLSDAVLSGILKNRTDLKTIIGNFNESYEQHIALIKEFGWKKLKDLKREQMAEKFGRADCSLEEFRLHANRLINALSIELGKELGLVSATWNAHGTSGYNSDVDTSLKIAAHLQNIEDAVLYKTLRDCLHIYVFGGLSSTQFDTQSYIPHPAEFNISQYLHSPLAHRYFQTGEKMSVVLQHYMSLHTNPRHCQESKEMDLKSISDDCERQAMALLYDQAEVLMEALEGKIGDIFVRRQDVIPAAKHDFCKKTCAENFDVYSEARMLAYVPLRVRLAELCSAVQLEIAREAKKLMAFSNQLSTAGEKDPKIDCQRELDSLHLEFQHILMFIAALQDEGTISVAEGKATLLEKGGQIHAGVLIQRKQSMTEILGGHLEALDVSLECSKLIRESSPRLLDTLGSKTPGTSDELARQLIVPGIEKNLQPFFQKSTGQTFLMAAYEESKQLMHVFHDALHGMNDPPAVAIACGKYVARTNRNNWLALKEFKEESDISMELMGMLAKARKLEKIGESLEKCKRGMSISSDAAAVLLTEAIIDGLSGRGGCCEITIHAKTKNMFREFDAGGNHEGRVLPKEEHFRLLCNALREAKDWFIDVTRPRIIAVLQAHAGIPPEAAQIHLLKFIVEKLDDMEAKKFLSALFKCRKDMDKNVLKLALESLNLSDEAQLQKLLSELVEQRKDIDQRAPQITLQSLKLTNEEQIREFLSGTIDFGGKGRNWARDKRFVALSTEQMARFFDFTPIIERLHS